MRSVHSRTRAPAKLVSTTMDFRAFVAKAPHLTIPRQRTLVYGGKLLFSNATAKIPKAICQKRHDGFSFLNNGNLDKCLSKKKSRLATPALWLSSPHWAKCMTNSYPLRSPSKSHANTTALIGRRPVTWVYLDLGISQTVHMQCVRYAFVRACMDAWAWACVGACVSVCVYMCMCVCVCLCVGVYMCGRARVCKSCWTFWAFWWFVHKFE